MGVEIAVDGFEGGVFGGDFFCDGVAQDGVGGGEGEGREGAAEEKRRGSDESGEAVVEFHGIGSSPSSVGRLGE